MSMLTKVRDIVCILFHETLIVDDARISDFSVTEGVASVHGLHARAVL